MSGRTVGGLCSVQGWKWKAKETQVATLENVVEQIALGGRMLDNGARRDLYLQVALQAVDPDKK